MLSLPVAAAVTVLTLATACCVSMLSRGDPIDHAANRLTMGVVTASLIIGSSIMMSVGSDRGLSDLPSFGLLGFIGVVIGGIWVLLSIWRSGRNK